VAPSSPALSQVYPAKDASDHEDVHCPDQLVLCFCGKEFQRKALSEHIMSDMGTHLVAQLSLQHRSNATLNEISKRNKRTSASVKELLERERRKDGKYNKGCKRRRLDMDDNGRFEWDFDLSVFAKGGGKDLHSETFCDRGFLFRLELEVEEQTDDMWTSSLYLRCMGKTFETTRKLVGVKADFQLGAGEQEDHESEEDLDLLKCGVGHGGIAVEKAQPRLMCWVKINALRAEYGLTEEEEEAERVAAGVEETKEQELGGP
jgi:hypothetical protein